MAKFGSYTQVINNGQRRTQTWLILLNHAKPEVLNAEISAAKQLGHKVVNVFLCIGHHENEAAKSYSVIVTSNRNLGKATADKISRLGQLLLTGNPNGKEIK